MISVPPVRTLRFRRCRTFRFMTAELPIDIDPIGYVTTSYTDPSGMPGQAAENTDAAGTLVVREAFVDALLGLDRYPFLWLLTWLHRGEPGPATLRVHPRATQATGEIQGVFASRWPRRPNSIGLSLVRRLELAGNVITFAGVDLLDGTPVLDIKPWFADCDLPSALDG
jgi:tRNA-Thr(GGU) m(6)t(6)A37 methyltransferase TsaA